MIKYAIYLKFPRGCTPAIIDGAETDSIPKVLKIVKVLLEKHKDTLLTLCVTTIEDTIPKKTIALAYNPYIGIHLVLSTLQKLIYPKKIKTRG